MTPRFSITCQSTRVEHPRSFYACFVLGPFHPDQSLTLANTLRRSLLADLPSLILTSLTLRPEALYYGVLPGVQESFQDVHFNLKKLVFRPSPTWSEGDPNNHRAYLKVRGPGTIRAADLRLPPAIQCVDGHQYIATLAEDGVLDAQLTIGLVHDYTTVKLETGWEERSLPVHRVNYVIERSETNPQQHRVVMEIWTNGSLHPRQALAMACKKVIRQFCELDRSVLI